MKKTAKVEVTIPLGSITLRAEDVSQDMYGSIDLVVDKIERQIRKNKNKKLKRKIVANLQPAKSLQTLWLRKVLLLKKLSAQKRLTLNQWN